MSEQFKSLPTNTGAAKLAYALATSTQVQISHMAIGDGNGAAVEPSATRAALVREVYRAPLNQLAPHPTNPNWLVAELVLPPEVGGWTIRELMLYDVNGDPIFNANHPAQYKPVQSEGSEETKTIRMVILVSSLASVTLKTDPTTVLATIAYVNSLGQTSAYDATAGRWLKVGAFGLGGAALTPPVNDLNQITVSGLYIGTAAIANQPPGRTLGTVLHIERGSLSAASQVWAGYFGVQSTNEQWVRYKNGGVWSAWQQVWHSGNLVKQVNPTDATAGALMSVGAFGLGAGPTLIGPDLDTLVVPGKYGIATTSTNVPLVGVVGVLDVTAAAVNGSNNRVVQSFSTVSGTQRTFVRGYNGTVWSTWVEVWNSGNLVKQASKYDKAEGAVLLQGAHGLGAALGSEVALSDFNDATLSTGWHRFNSSAVNGPSSSGFKIVNVLNYTSTFCVQIAYTMGPGAPVNIRFYVSGVWGDWLPMWHGGNLVKQATAQDATPGAVLLTGAFGLGGAMAVLVDVDTVNKTGFYIVTDATTGTKPTTTGTLLHFERGSSNQVTQIFDSLIGSGPQQMWIRTKYSGGTWSTWQALLHGGNAAALPLLTAMAADSDNLRSLGLAGKRWSTVYAGTGTINTSDAREKTPVRALTPAEVEAAKQLAKEVGAYRFLSAVAEKADEAREHIGMTVQRAIEVMESHGLDPFGYGFICFDTWDDEWREMPAVMEDQPTGEVGEDGEPVMESVEIEPARRELIHAAGDRYSFRPDELLLFIAAGLEARLAALEAAAA